MYGQLTAEGLAPSSIRSLVGCSEDLTPSFSLFSALRELPGLFPCNGSAATYNLYRSIRERYFDLENGNAFARRRRKAAGPAKGG